MFSGWIFLVIPRYSATKYFLLFFWLIAANLNLKEASLVHDDISLLTFCKDSLRKKNYALRED